MRFFPAEPDISTVFNRIVGDDIDLQPDFQRGEVWPVTKQQRLIDTILRGWVVPPILLVSSGPGHRQQVLDGQQRLAAIRDFKLNKFPIDGRIKPFDPKIHDLHGLKFEDLPSDVAKWFDRTTLRIYEVADYKPEEPAEIFFRLNQPTALTSAEKRNAFFGPVRDQIRHLVEEFETQADTMSLLGFTNSRMAYDDVFARFACALELATLRKKITAASVNEMYRRTHPLSNDVHARLRTCVRLSQSVLSISHAESMASEYSHRLNKATFFSWLVFFCRLDAVVDAKTLSAFFQHFETARTNLQPKSIVELRSESKAGFMQSWMVSLLSAYTDRATSRVADVSSVLIRDFSIWVFWHEFSHNQISHCTDPAYLRIDDYINADRAYHTEQSAISFLDYVKWGERL